jgi:hypothetical protein
LSIAAPLRFVGAVGGSVSVLDGIVTVTGSPAVALPNTSRAMTWNS